MKWIAAVMAVLALGCSQQPEQRLVYEGQRMAPIGATIATPKGDMVAVGKTADGRDVFVRQAGGGGTGERPLFVQAGPGVYQQIEPYPFVGR